MPSLCMLGLLQIPLVNLSVVTSSELFSSNDKALSPSLKGEENKQFVVGLLCIRKIVLKCLLDHARLYWVNQWLGRELGKEEHWYLVYRTEI